MKLMNDVVIENKVIMLDTTDLDNIHDVVVVKELVINDVKELVKYLTIDVSEYDDADLGDLVSYICSSFRYDYDMNIDDVEVDSDVLEQLKEYVIDYYE